MVIFYSHVSHYQRVNPIKSHETTIFPWFPMVFHYQRVPPTWLRYKLHSFETISGCLGAAAEVAGRWVGAAA